MLVAISIRNTEAKRDNCNVDSRSGKQKDAACDEDVDITPLPKGSDGAGDEPSCKEKS